MTPPKSPRQKTVKRLFAVSGNRCAFPACDEPLVHAESGKVTGRICHIRGRRSGGPRFDPDQDDKARHGFDNLLLLCPIHHDVIDAEDSGYSVEDLERMKAEHEGVASAVEDVSDRVIEALLAGLAVSGAATRDVVLSINQSGGQTAHTIHNHGPATRTLGETTRAAMLRVLASHSGTVGFASTQGDPEAANFKKLLIRVFREAGWEVRDMATFMFFGSHMGLKLTIPFGAPEEGLPQIVAEALGLTGNPIVGNRGDMANDCGVYVQVWHAPVP